MSGALHHGSVAGLTRDTTREPGKKPLPASTVQHVIDLVPAPPPDETSHWPDVGEGGRREPAIGAAYPRCTTTRAAPHSYLQAVE
jgi:hypothetical protein